MTRWFLFFIPVLAAAAVVAVACTDTNPPKPPPIGQFYWPSGLVFVPGPTPDGTLFVANADFDRRFDNGSIMGINLAMVGDGGVDSGLPPFGDPVPPTGPKQIPGLNVNPSVGVAQISGFAGVMAAAPLIDGGLRLFVPTRAEAQAVYAVDVTMPTDPMGAPVLSCVKPVNYDGGTVTERFCQGTGMTAMANLYIGNGLPRGPAPYGVAVSQDGNAYVTHLQNADTPVNSTLNVIAYIIKINIEQPQITDDSFIPISYGGTDSIVAGKKWVYATGRYFAPIAYLLRMVDANGDFYDPGVENAYKSLESRGVALNSDESRLYIAGRSPDELIVCSVTYGDTDTPLVKAMHAVALPESPDQIATIPRAGHSDLVVIVSIDAATMAFYDDDTGQLVGDIGGLGIQPFAIAVDRRDGASARIYVSNFADGRVAVIDVPDLTRPDHARLVAHLSANQLCLTRGTAGGACDGGVQ